MAGSSDKKQAQENTKILKSLHILSISVNLLSIISIFLLGRPANGKKYFILFTIPSIICEYLIESFGRPVYTVNENGYQVLVKTGEDLTQEGLTEYLFDIVYLTLIIDVLMCIFGSMKFWYLWSAIPLFAIWKVKGLIGTVWGMFRPKAGKTTSSGLETAGGGDSEPSKSKRQQKLESRGNKQKVRYR